MKSTRASSLDKGESAIDPEGKRERERERERSNMRKTTIHNLLVITAKVKKKVKNF